MEVCKIFLSGGMSGLTQKQQWAWRKEVEKELTEFRYGTRVKPEFFNPCLYYNVDEDYHKTENEHFEFDTYNLRKSDLVIVNFNAPNSIGSAMELMLAKELHIPIIGLNENKRKLHPWLEVCCNRICDDMEELVDHVAACYLN